jgi:Fe-S-cluster containining protein
MSTVPLPVAAPAPAAEVWGCVKCAQITRTCCQQREIFVTVGDQARITRHTGLSGFWEYRAPTDPDYVDQDHDPNWLRWVFRPDGTRPILRRAENGDCSFLTPAGCQLPVEIRPIVCRLYPFAYTEAGLTGIDSACPPEVIPPGSHLLQVLDMRLADAQRWHAMLYHELRTRTPYDAET